MITDKEYPATHSMSTSWYIVDKDGNVGVMLTDDNGPATLDYADTALHDMIINADAERKRVRLDYSEEQILEFLSPCDEVTDCVIPPDFVVKIRTSEKERFLELMENPDIRIEACISEKHGYYMIEADDYDSGKAPTFSQIQKEGIVVATFRLQPFWARVDRSENGEAIVKKDFASCPFYVYGSDYSAEHRQVRICEPRNPVRVGQMDDGLLSEVVKVPLRFSESQALQIAEFMPFRKNWSELQSCRFNYHYMELNDGSWGYILDNVDDGQPMPRMFQICGYNDMETCGFSACPFVKDVTLYVSIMDDYQWESETTAGERTDSFAARKSLIDYGINLIEPYLIIISDGILDLVSEFYPMQDGGIVVGGRSYPVIAESAIMENERRIRDIRRLPYRGKSLPKVIRRADLKD